MTIRVLHADDIGRIEEDLNKEWIENHSFWNLSEITKTIENGDSDLYVYEDSSEVCAILFCFVGI